MPSCRPDVIPAVLYKVMELKPRTILDVGAGCGKWGCLLTEYLHYWTGQSPQICAVEPFGDYWTPAYMFYKHVFECDVMSITDKFINYELVLAIDVIEHLSRENGLKLLSAIANHYIVSTPAYWSPQEAVFGNERERHISIWAPTDFENSTLISDHVGRHHIFAWR